MAVAFDAVGPSSTGFTQTSGTTATWSHTCGSSATVLFVGVGVPNSANYSLTCTYAGVSMTSLGRIESGGGTDGGTQLFALLNPAIGANNVVVTQTLPSNFAAGNALVGGSVSYSGASGWGTAVTASSSSGNPSVTVSSAAGNMVFAVAAMSSVITANNQTERVRQNQNGGNAADNVELQDAAGAASVTLTVTHASDWWSSIGVSITAAAGGATTADSSPILRPGFMSGTAFPSFMDAPNIAGWSPFGMAYDLGLSGPQAYTSPLTGTVGFTGADAVLTSKGLTAATVGFTGSLTKRLARALAATVSFTGALGTAAVHNFTQALTATLSFTGAQSRRVGKGLAATVSFTGAQARAIAVNKSATVSFTGTQTRRVASTLAAAVSFTGAQTRRIGHGMTAAVSFTGNFATAAVHFFTQSFTATVGFTGSIATLAVHFFTKALTATVGFTGAVTRRTARSVAATVGLTAGNLTRRIGSNQSATVGFTGSIRRAIGRRLSAAVGFVGNLLGSGGSTTVDPNPQTATFIEQATATFVESATATFIEHATATAVEQATAEFIERATATNRSR